MPAYDVQCTAAYATEDTVAHRCRLGYRDGIGDAAPTTRAIEVRDL
ncbi:hypothetical protein OHA21_15735 [Actinoplanes sp. NBC_00393]